MARKLQEAIERIEGVDQRSGRQLPDPVVGHPGLDGLPVDVRNPVPDEVDDLVEGFAAITDWLKAEVPLHLDEPLAFVSGVLSEGYSVSTDLEVYQNGYVRVGFGVRPVSKIVNSVVGGGMRS